MASSTFFKLATGATFTLPGYPAKENGTSVVYTKLDATRARDEFGRIWSFSPSLAIGAQGFPGQSGTVPTNTDTGTTSSGGSGQRGPKGDKGDKGDPGAAGPPGADGKDGADSGLLYKFSSDVTGSDPGPGVFKLDDPTPSSALELFVSKTTFETQDVGALLASWAASTSAVQSTLLLVKEGSPDVFMVLQVNGGVVDNTTWDNFGIAVVASSVTQFNSGDLVRIFFSNSGDGGANGGTAHIVIPSNSSITVGTGSKTFSFTSAVVAPDYVGWDIGTRVIAISAANTANFLSGAVTAITMAALPTRAVSVTVLVDLVGGSGTFSDFTISLAGLAGQGVPTGGTTGQVLTKNSNTDFDDSWQTPASGADVLQVQVFS